ncbi:MAG: uroporphyrinogen decarboxylase [Calditrichaeota bacterium]|nr:MAG: uroporphyrinogen decarboxylase [Calditrichota bacterium]
MNDQLFIKSAFSQKVERPPVWMMRQAGRFMKEYRAIRENYSFLEMMKNPEIATDVTMLPVDLLGIDAAIMFCDILVTAEALGGQLSFVKGKGPVFANPVRSKSDVEKMVIPETYEEFGYVFEMIKNVKERLNGKTPLIGFAGSPFTVMSYLVEGQSSKDLKLTKLMINTEPETAKLLLSKLATVTANYLNAQIEAGVDALQIFDSWANTLSWEDYQEFSHFYIAEIISKLNRKDIPIISFCKGSSVFHPIMAEAKPDVISVDWNADLLRVKQSLPNEIAVQGNLDPFVLYGSREIIRKKVMRILEKMRNENGFIFNLGHGIMPDIPFDNVKYAIELIQEFRN